MTSIMQFGVMAVRWGDIDRQRDAVFLNRHLDLDAADLLAAIVVVAIAVS